MNENFLQWIQNFSLTDLFNSITSIFTWVLDGLTSLITSVGYFISLLITTIADVSNYAVSFGTILQSVFNAIPAFYLQMVIFTILTTIILQSIRRFL